MVDSFDFSSKTYSAKNKTNGIKIKANAKKGAFLLWQKSLDRLL